MPELYTGPARQQKNTTHIGEGSEHEVFLRSDKNVIKEKSPNIDALMNTPEYLRAEFFLTKIAHLLYPDSIPDVHAVHLTGQKGEAQTVHTYVDTSGDTYHEDVRQSWIDPNHPIPQYEHIQNELAQRARIVSPFQSQLEKSGIVLFDKSLQNYTITGTTIQYVDRLYPLRWDEETKSYISIDLELIRKAIEKNIVDTDTQTIARHYLARLEHFLHELEKKKTR